VLVGELGVCLLIGAVALLLCDCVVNKGRLVENRVGKLGRQWCCR
jgi:hypothetical protein